MRRRVLLLLQLIVFAGLVLWLTEALRTPAPSDAPAPSEAARADEAGTAVLRGTTASPAAQEAAPRRGEPGRVRIVGRVLAASGTEAAAGATVAARAEGRDLSQVSTDKDGRFELVYGAAPTYEVDVALSIQARDGTGTTAAAQIVPQGPEVVDVGVLHLRATTRLEVRTLHVGKPVAGAHVYASSVPTSSRPSQSEQLSFSSTTPSFAYEAVSNDSGLAAFECLPVGAVQLFAVADGPLRGELLVSTDRGEEPVDLPLVEARDLRVQVVWRDGGAPIPGCILLVRSAGRLPLVEPAVRPVTNRDGLAVLHGVPDDVALEIAVIHRDWCSAYMSGIASTAEAGTRELRIEIPAALTLRFPIRIQDGPNPPDGTQVELLQSDWAFWPGSRLGLARSGVIDGSELVVDFHRMFHERATARLPDGRVGGLVLTTDYDRTTKRSHPRLPLAEVVFAYPRTVVVEVRERRTGRGVPGVAVRAFLRGCDRTTAPVRTDQDGEARIDGLPAVKGWVSVCSNPELVRPSRQGVFSQRQDIDLGEGDAHLTFEVEPLQEGIVQVTTEGRRELPAGFAAEIWLLPEGLTWRTPDDLVIDPRLAQVRFQIRPPPTEAAQPARVTHAGEVLLRLTSDTHATEHVRLAAGRPLVAEVDLLPAASLLTRVVKPDSVSVQTQLESRGLDGAWTPVWEDAVAPFPGEVPEGSSLYVGLRPGRYRIHAPRLGSSSAELDVPPGPQPATLVWDLTPSEYAEGEVVLPPGVDPRGLRIFVLEADGPPRIVASTPDLEGTHFRVQIPGDRPVVLRPLHPECQPDEEDGSATVTRSTAGLVLRMALRPR